MPYPMLRETERPRADPQSGTPGLRVVCVASGRTYFFPGGTADLAMVLARMNLFDGTLDHPRTEIAFGEKRGGAWAELQVIKAGPKGAA